MDESLSAFPSRIPGGSLLRWIALVLNRQVRNRRRNFFFQVPQTISIDSDLVKIALDFMEPFYAAKADFIPINTAVFRLALGNHGVEFLESFRSSPQQISYQHGVSGLGLIGFITIDAFERSVIGGLTAVLNQSDRNRRSNLFFQVPQTISIDSDLVKIALDLVESIPCCQGRLYSHQHGSLPAGARQSSGIFP